MSTNVILEEESWLLWTVRTTAFCKVPPAWTIVCAHGRHPRGGIVALVDNPYDGFLQSAARVDYVWSTVVILGEESWPKWTARTTAFYKAPSEDSPYDGFLHNAARVH